MRLRYVLAWRKSTYCLTHNEQKEATLATPDPPTDSQTSRLVGQSTPYMVPTYVRPPPMFQKGEGSYLWDVENRQYLDFTSGIAVNALGHCDPEMSVLIAQQVSRLPCHFPSLQSLTLFRRNNSFTLQTSTTTPGPAPSPSCW